jgi:hypothetical protein
MAYVHPGQVMITMCQRGVCTKRPMVLTAEFALDKRAA